jgi:hypothetical protein
MDRRLASVLEHVSKVVLCREGVEAPGDRGPRRVPLLHSLGQFSPVKAATATGGFSHGTVSQPS